MITTLDKLEDHVIAQKPLWKWRKTIKDIKVFAVLFVVVYAINTVVVNFELFVIAFSAEDSLPVMSEAYQPQVLSDTVIEKRIVHEEKKSITREEALEKQEEQKKISELNTMLSAYKPEAKSDLDGDIIVEEELRLKLNDYNIEFNRLPPSDRLVIASLGIDVPLVDPDFVKPIDQLTTEDFDRELYRWVVKYPTTPYPWSDPKNGNTMIVGHTSFDYYKKNPYWSIFSKIPKLKEWDEIEVISRGKMYKYKIIFKEVVHPTQVNEEYLKFVDWNYITLLGCYPIWSDRNRMFIVAEYIP